MEPSTPPRRANQRVARRLAKQISDAKTTPAKPSRALLGAADDEHCAKRLRVQLGGAEAAEAAAEASAGTSPGGSPGSAAAGSPASAAEGGPAAGRAEASSPLDRFGAASSAANSSSNHAGAGNTSNQQTLPDIGPLPLPQGDLHHKHLLLPSPPQGPPTPSPRALRRGRGPWGAPVSPTSEADSPMKIWDDFAPAPGQQQPRFGAPYAAASPPAHRLGGDDASPYTPPDRIIRVVRTPAAPQQQPLHRLESWERRAMTHGGSSEWGDGESGDDEDGRMDVDCPQ